MSTRNGELHLRSISNSIRGGCGTPPPRKDPEVPPVTPKATRAIFYCLPTGIGVALWAGLMPISPGGGCAWAQPERTQAERVVFLAGDLPDASLICLTAILTAKDHQAVLLLDSPKLDSQQKRFLQSFLPDRVIPVGSFPKGATDLEQRLGVKGGPVGSWTG